MNISTSATSLAEPVHGSALLIAIIVGALIFYIANPIDR